MRRAGRQPGAAHGVTKIVPALPVNSRLSSAAATRPAAAPSKAAPNAAESPSNAATTSTSVSIAASGPDAIPTGSDCSE